ncbi:hypothetical protein HGRIS_013772 [Hohenbuehelia grisea]|uniref:Uncharacterized protein n=1 Tax=Hohenbuehelia grisea TaxID=104357 RepID=A0ABR3IWN3_9AGAR
MRTSTIFFALVSAALATASTPGIAAEAEPRDLKKHETSYGNPDLVTDQGNRFKLNFGSTQGHPNACPGSYICYISKNGAPHNDVSLGNPDDFVDEGNRWRLNYGSPRGHPNACDGHYICYLPK